MVKDGSDRVTLPDLLHRGNLHSQVLGCGECGRLVGGGLVGHGDGLWWVTYLRRAGMFLLTDLVQLVIKGEL